MATITATVTVRFRWWLRPWITFVVLKARVMGKAVDMDRVEAVMHRAIITTVR